MKKLIWFIPVIVFLIILAFGYKYLPFAKSLYKIEAEPETGIISLIEQASPLASSQNSTDFPLTIPAGYKLSIFAKNLNNPRDMIIDNHGNIIVSITSLGKVMVVNKDGKACELIKNLNKPHGLALYRDYKLYVAETNVVKVYDYDPVTCSIGNSNQVVELPGGGIHFTRSLIIKDDRLYVSVGSSCNVCDEENDKRAAIWSSAMDGSDFKPFANGLRNAVFMALHPDTKEIWATNMGRDNLGDDLPPDTVNVIKENANYGWPYCYGNKITDNETNKNNSKYDCKLMQSPQLELPAHSAPLGLDFWNGSLLVVYHGSWNRTSPTGYKVVKFTNGKSEDFISGWLSKDGDVLGRPSDIVVKDENQIFISDDKAGVIYLLSKI